jgi:hypothetical protein
MMTDLDHQTPTTHMDLPVRQEVFRVEASTAELCEGWDDLALRRRLLQPRAEHVVAAPPLAGGPQPAAYGQELPTDSR